MENQAQAGTPVGGEAPSHPELSITDLQNLRSIVDVAVRRGAFAANEMSAVGATFDRVNAFLNAVAPQKTEETATEQAPAA